MKFTPTKESKQQRRVHRNYILLFPFFSSTVKQLTTHVQALINNFPFPFVGVDGTSACNNVFDEEGNKLGCPLKKGKTYIYKNSFKVLEIYPKIQMVVHWALQTNNQDVMCFEVPARIV